MTHWIELFIKFMLFLIIPGLILTVDKLHVCVREHALDFG